MTKVDRIEQIVRFTVRARRRFDSRGALEGQELSHWDFGERKSPDCPEP